MTQNKTWGILLAAGRSKRFGGPKLLEPLANGMPIAVMAARNMCSVLDNVVAVLKPGDDYLGELLQREGAQVLYCPSAHQGMGHSLAHGVKAASAANAWVIALADMPAIQSSTIKSVVDVIEQGALIAAPKQEGRRGHPVAFSNFFYDELVSLKGDRGARPVIERHSEDVVHVETHDPGVLIDLDYREDLVKLRNISIIN